MSWKRRHVPSSTFNLNVSSFRQQNQPIRWQMRLVSPVDPGEWQISTISRPAPKGVFPFAFSSYYTDKNYNRI